MTGGWAALRPETEEGAVAAQETACQRAYVERPAAAGQAESVAKSHESSKRC